jgi:hypothetical protein
VYVVIDAQLVAYFYIEEILQKTSPCTSSASDLFARLSVNDIALVDDADHIYNEWKQQSAGNPEWFDAWYGDLLAIGGIVEIKAATHKNLVDRLKKDCGFPKSKDTWYIRTAATGVDDFGSAVGLISEDLDFYAPKEKACGGKRRQKILLDTLGSVAKTLRKSADVRVRCVAVHLS